MYLKTELYELRRTDESIFDFIQESVSDGLWYRDLENPENEWMNAKFWKVLGYNPDEMPHKSSSWQNIINQDDLKVAIENFTKHLENPNHPYDQVVRYTHKDGSTVWIRCRGFAIRDNTGKPIRMLGTHQDISDIKRSEQELIIAKEKAEESEEKYRNLVDNSTDIIYSINTEGKITFITPNVSNYGYASEDIIGHNMREFIHQDDIEDVLSFINKSLETGDKTAVEFRLLSKAGDTMWFEGSRSQIKGHAGLTGFSGVIRDITERKRAEEALRESESLLDATGFMARVGGWQLDVETMTVTWTKETYHIHEVPLNYKPPLDKAIEFFHPDDRDALSQAMQQALDRGEPYDMELRFITAKGNNLWTRSTCQPEIVDGKTVRLRGTFQDITERIESEKKQEELTIFLRSIFESLNDPFAVIDANDNTIVMANKAYGGQSAVGKKKKCYSISHREDAPCKGKDHRCPLIYVKESGKPCQVEHLHFVNGKPKYIQILASPIFDHRGEVKHIIEYCIDITERKQAEEALRESEVKLKSIFRVAPTGIGILTNRTFNEVNPKVCEMTGYH